MTQFRIVSLSVPKLSIMSPNRSLHLELGVQLMAHAATSGQPDLVRVISEYSSSHLAVYVVTECDSRGNTPLMHAAMSGNSEVVQAMIDHCSENGVAVASILNRPNTAGKTALMLAISHGKSADCVQVLLTNGADPNTIVASSWLSALEVAMREGHLDILRTLLAHPDIHISDRALTTISGRDCTVVLTSKALEREPDLLSRLVNGNPFAHWLADYNGGALRDIVAGKDDGFIRGILSIADQEGFSVAHRLAQGNGVALGNILAGKDAGFGREILSIADQEGFSVAHLLAQINGVTLQGILAEKNEEFGREILSIARPYWYSVAHRLAYDNGEALRDILAGKDADLFGIFCLLRIRMELASPTGWLNITAWRCGTF